MAVIRTSSFADFSKKLVARAKDIKDRVEAMKGKKVVVGIPASAKYPNGKSVAEVAELITNGVLENGAPSSKPPRPFMKIAVEENKKKWNRRLQEGVRAALRERKKPDLRPLLIDIGEEMQKDIRRVMVDMDIGDTGRMHNSISILQINDQRIQDYIEG